MRRGGTNAIKDACRGIGCDAQQRGKYRVRKNRL